MWKRSVGVSLVTGEPVLFYEAMREPAACEKAGEVDVVARELHLATMRRVLRAERRAP